MKLIFRIRTWSDTPGRCDVWIIQQSGAALSYLLHGNLPVQAADELAAVLGLPVERENVLGIVGESS